ncbi:MAG TPA: ABC transporter transmembrane domain-containing protein [Actinomycetospora sp.]|uniref:ABC transporter ATP-binding protein n=1 Tax=Actinomycetospora sp. TaxID=1872135 RepID=UPI002F41F9DE
MGAHTTLVGLPAVDGDDVPETSSGVGGAAAPARDRTDHDGGASTSPHDEGASGTPAPAGGPDAPAMTLRAIFRRFWPYTRSDRSKLLFAFLAMAASTACDTYVVTMFARIVDGATVAHSMSAVWPSAIEWLVLTAIGGLLSVLGGFLLVGAAERFVFRLRHEVFAHLQRLGPRFLGEHATGDLMSRLTADVDGVEALASSGIVSTVIAVGTAVAYAAAAVLVQWQLAVIVVALAPLMWLTSRITGRFTKTAARTERRAAGEVGTAVEQALSNLPLVQAYGTEATESARLDHHGEIWWRARARESRLQMIYSPITTLIQSGALLAVLIAGAAFIAAGELTVGGLFGFAAYLGYLYPPLSQLGALHLTVTSASASCERLIEILDAEPEVQDSPDADGSVVREGHLELCGARYVYPGTDDAGLDGISLDVRPGQFVLVTGPSGAGKSTMTKMLLRFLDAQDGAVILDGVDVRDRTIKAVREAVTLLPQEPMLFDMTVAENISYARPDATRAEIEQAAREAGALDFIRELPQGFDTGVGEDGAALSGGQRQRLAIARALLRVSPVLVLDEPTTGLDAPTARAVLEPLRRLAGGRTTIVISHDLTPARDADLVVVLEDGRIVARGRHHDLLAAGGTYARLWAAQHGGAPPAETTGRPDDVAAPAPRRATPFRPAPGAVEPPRPAPPRRAPARVPALDPAAVRAPDPVTAPLRLLARSSTTTGPTPIRSRPAPASRTAVGGPPPGRGPGSPPVDRASAAGPPAPAPRPTARISAPGPAAPTPGRLVDRTGGRATLPPGRSPVDHTRVAGPATTPTGPAAGRPAPTPAPGKATATGTGSPSGNDRASSSPAHGPASTGRDETRVGAGPGTAKHGLPSPRSDTTSTPRPPGPTPSSSGPSSSGPSSSGPSSSGPSSSGAGPTPARSSEWTVPGPRHPASGPTPARSDENAVETTGRLARRTVADLVAGTARPPARTSHRAEPTPPRPRSTVGSHRAPER